MICFPKDKVKCTNVIKLSVPMAAYKVEETIVIASCGNLFCLGLCTAFKCIHFQCFQCLYVGIKVVLKRREFVVDSLFAEPAVEQGYSHVLFK